MIKWVIASDIHGSVKSTKKLLETLESEKADRLMLLGDLLYHGPRNDLPDTYNTQSVAKLLNSKKDKILCVRGNCDSEVDQMILNFPIMGEYAVLTAGDHIIYATHGHRYNKSNLPGIIQEGDILLCGHTHIPAFEKCKGYFYFNPGSISIPKGGSGCGYMTLYGTTFEWKTFEGKTFKSIDVDDYFNFV